MGSEEVDTMGSEGVGTKGSEGVGTMGSRGGGTMGSQCCSKRCVRLLTAISILLSLVHCLSLFNAGYGCFGGLVVFGVG